MVNFGEVENESQQQLLLDFYKHFWILLPLGGTFGYFHTKTWKWATLINYGLMYTSVPTFIGLLVYTSFLVSDNVVLFSLAAHLLIVGCVAMGASLLVAMRRRDILRASVFYSYPYFADYNRCEYFQDLRKKTLIRKNYRIALFFFLYAMCALVGVLQPAIDELFNQKLLAGQYNGVWLNLPIIVWFPLDIENSTLAYLAVYLLEGIFVTYASIMVTSGNALCFLVMDQILDQFRVLIYSIDHLEERALRIFLGKYPGAIPKRKPNEFEECCCECIVQNVKHHHRILKYTDVLVDIMSLPVAIPFFGGALLLGLAAITLTADGNLRMAPKIMAAGLAFSEALNMYQLCYYGQQFENLSSQLFNTLYFTRWYKRSAKWRKLLIGLRNGCFKPLSLCVGKLLVLNMKLFGDLVNSAYSIFNLKNASSIE